MRHKTTLCVDNPSNNIETLNIYALNCVSLTAVRVIIEFNCLHTHALRMRHKQHMQMLQEVRKGETKAIRTCKTGSAFCTHIKITHTMCFYFFMKKNHFSDKTEQ